MVQTVDLSNILGTFPLDCIAQQDYMGKLLTILNNSINKLESNPTYLQLDQDFEPTQEDWEAKWVLEGYTLPIHPTATLIWWDSYNDSIGGFYGTVLGNTQVYRREHSTPKGSTVYFDQDNRNDVQTFTTAIGATASIMPLLTFNLPCICDLYISYYAYVTLTAGSGVWGVNFMLNTINVGEEVFAVPANYGITNNSATGMLVAQALIRNVPAGDYTLQSLMGVVGLPASPPTIRVSDAGTPSNRFLSARAIAVG